MSDIDTNAVHIVGFRILDRVRRTESLLLEDALKAAEDLVSLKMLTEARDALGTFDALSLREPASIGQEFRASQVRKALLGRGLAGLVDSLEERDVQAEGCHGEGT
jgi:hypothetical protein